MNVQSVGACCLVVLLLAAGATPGFGNTIEVGASQQLKLPSQAALVARSGDTIQIEPGEYTDCAVWRTSDLTIEGKGNGAVLANKSCAGKGIFVIVGDGITVRNLTFAHATVPDRNGAAIRVEGRNLTVEHSRFIDNENGILADAAAGSTLKILDSEFRGNGKCDPQCAHGIYAGAIDTLDIEGSSFVDQHVGHHIKSRALHTILINNDIADGPDGNSSFLVDISNGGDLLMQGNRLEKGPHSENRETAVAIGFEGMKNPTRTLIIRGNSFTNDMPTATHFVSNRTSTPVALSANQFHGHTTPLAGRGSVSP